MLGILFAKLKPSECRIAKIQVIVAPLEWIKRENREFSEKLSKLFLIYTSDINSRLS
jgi:hypothetical protein